MLEPVLVTGAAGFIGFSIARRLLERGRVVLGVDNLNAYYDPALKAARLAVLRQFDHFEFHKLNLADRHSTESLFRSGHFGPVIHFAAQPGVRFALDHPHDYVEANLAAFLNVIEGCRYRETSHLIYASSSSVYGMNSRSSFSETDNVDHPTNLYAATKKANELMAHAYSYVHAIPSTGLRFFTVYGPWGRPDMAVYLFAKAISEARPIKLFNSGRMYRDFTYVDDVMEVLERMIDRPPNVLDKEQSELGRSTPAPWRIYNIGNNRPIEVVQLVRLLECELGREAVIELLPMQPGEVSRTCANIDAIERDFEYRISVPIEEGIRRFVAWFRNHERVASTSVVSGSKVPSEGA